MYIKAIKTGFLAALLLIACAAGASAQETSTPAKRELVKELLELTGGTKTLDAMMEAMIAQQEKDLPKLLEQLSGQTEGLSPEDRAEVDRHIKESAFRAIQRMREVFQRINYAQALDDLAAPIFDKHFSESELREWIVFYKSPVGKKSIELIPVMMTEMMAKMSETLLPRIQEEMSAIIAEESKYLAQHAKSVSTSPRTTPKPRKRSRH